MTTLETTLRERALQAAKTARQEREAQDCVRAVWATHETTRMLRERAERLGIYIPADQVVDGVYREEGLALTTARSFLVVLGHCPRCREEVASEPIKYLHEIGEMLLEFRPHYDHTCELPYVSREDRERSE
jgi:hypothetical protein